MSQCQAKTGSAKQCKNPAAEGSAFCHQHKGWKRFTRRLVWLTRSSVFLAITAVLAVFADMVDIIDLFPSKTPIVPAPPAAEKFYYMTVVDASNRMLDSIPGSEQKWQAALRSLQQKISFLPPGANYGLIAFGQQGSPAALQCDQSAEVVVPVDTPASGGRPKVGASQQKALEATSQLKPGGTGSLTRAVSLAVNQVSKLPGDFSKTLIIVTGGGDACDPQTEWEFLELLRIATSKDFTVYTELIVFIPEEVREEIVAKVEKITVLRNVTVSLPTTPEELDEDLQEAVNRAVERGMEVDPTPFVFQETSIAATRVSSPANSVAAVPTQPPAAIIPVQHEPSTVNVPATAVPVLPSATPQAISTNTATRLPPTNTVVPPANTATSLPPTATNIPPTPVPPTPVPPTPTASDIPFNCQSTRPALPGGALPGSVTIDAPQNCSTDHIPGTGIDTWGTYAGLPPDAVVWVFVYPPNGPYYPQSPNACAGPYSPPPSQGGGGWSVPSYLGITGDSLKTFDIMVAVVDQDANAAIGQRLYEDCANGFYDGISADELSQLNIAEKASITVRTR